MPERRVSPHVKAVASTFILRRLFGKAYRKEGRTKIKKNHKNKNKNKEKSEREEIDKEAAVV